MKTPNNFNEALDTLRAALGQAAQARSAAQDALAALEQYETETAAEIAKYLRASGSLELDLDAIRATTTRPYTLIPQDQHKALLVHWRGVKLPIFGWVKKQEGAFTISEVSRGMDALTPFPDWMRDEMGWQPPAHQAVIDGTRTQVTVTGGDPATFKKRYGSQLGKQNADGSFAIRRGDAWIKLVAQLVKDGILPWQAQPVSVEDWTDVADSPVILKDYQTPVVEEFKRKGALFLNLPPGAGKTYIAAHIMDHLAGKILVFAPSVILCEQWRQRIRDLAPHAQDVTILTYASGKKALDHEWSFVIFDEVQTLPANTFSKLAFLKTKYRIGLSASPWREDGRQYLIAALSGFPAHIPWSQLIVSGVLQRPRLVVVTVPTDAAKTAYVRQLVAQRRGGDAGTRKSTVGIDSEQGRVPASGRALIFCDYLEAGNALANALEVPFVSGETPHKLERVQQALVCVVSRIADRGLDFPDLKLVIEVAFLGKSREQEAQRFGRLLHSQSQGAHYLLFTPAEMDKFKGRLYGIEAELAGAIDIEFQTVGKVSEPREGEIRVRASRTPRRAATLHKEKAISRPASELDSLLATPAVAKLLAQAEGKMTANVRGLIRTALGLVWTAPLSIEEIQIGKGLSSRMTDYYRKAFGELKAVGLVSELSDNRFMADRGKINNLVTLSGRFR